MNASERKTPLENEFVRWFGTSPTLFVQAPGRVAAIPITTWDTYLPKRLIAILGSLQNPGAIAKYGLHPLMWRAAANSSYQLSSVTS
jgi:hypothetical protein